MSLPVVVRPVDTARDLERFIDLPYRLHRGDPHWVPQLRMDVRTMLSKKKNPFFQHSEAQYFIAECTSDYQESGGQAVGRSDGSGSPVRPSARPPVRWRKGDVVGRIAAIQNRQHNQYYHDTVGFFGFFESVDDQAVADALFTAAAAWLRERKLTVMRGPTSFSTNDECGLLVEGFDTPPTLLNPHNPSYYVPLVERAGFTKVKDMYQYSIAVTDRDIALPERLVRGAQIAADRYQLTARRLNMKRFTHEVNSIKQVYNSAWDKNWGFVPLTDAEIDHLAKQLRPIVVPEGVVFVEKEGKLVGFAAALPDFNVALKKNPSGRLFPGILKILWAARKNTRGRILLLGLLPEYRKTGAEVLLYKWIWEKGYALGFRWAEAGWILEDNAAMNNGLERMGFTRYKTLRIYDRPL